MLSALEVLKFEGCEQNLSGPERVADVSRIESKARLPGNSPPVSGDAQQVFDTPNLFQSQYGRLSQLLDIERRDAAGQLHHSVRHVALNAAQGRVAGFTKNPVDGLKKRTVVWSYAGDHGQILPDKKPDSIEPGTAKVERIECASPSTSYATAMPAKPSSGRWEARSPLIPRPGSKATTAHFSEWTR
jgi:hypothetical protein